TALEARSPGEALVAAESVGFPVAMKISSPHITHKRDVDGVRLDVRDARSVRGAYTEIIEAVRQAAPDAELRGVTVEPMRGGAHARELIVGVTRDSVFGPVVTFGSGGSMTEILRDRAVALPPLNTFIASDLIRRTRISRLLERQRNMPPANLEAVREVLLQVSNLVCSLPHVREMDINPLMVDENGAVAVDARFAIEHPPSSPDRYGHLAIHPYPAHLVSRHQLPDGTDVTIRPIRPEDAEIEQAFVSNLSAEAKYFRFMETLERLSPAMLARFTQIDYDREMALIAVRHDGDREEEIGVARYTMDPDEEGCEFALVVSDRERRRGLGSRLMHALMESARAKGLSRMHGEVLATNSNMLRLMRHLGFTSTTDEDDPGIRRVAVQL
ncbi:MAG: GNAT family N-acetyltransferase, partial [Ectothiorhodospiraceae bacterium]